jgi:hypothetical protein
MLDISLSERRRFVVQNIFSQIFATGSPNMHPATLVAVVPKTDGALAHSATCLSLNHPGG